MATFKDNIKQLEQERIDALRYALGNFILNTQQASTHLRLAVQ